MNNFSCKDTNVEDFLKNKALDFDARNVARTYLLIDEEQYLRQVIIILAYFTISLKPLVFDEKVSMNKVKQIDGFSKHTKSVAVVLIGQLGKDTTHAPYISGSYILELAMNIVYRISALAGCRIALLECMPIDKLLDFYKSNGFVFLQQSRDNELLQLIRFL
ncbi:hypothetical protein AGMMS49975_25990 [Clostridia bacterium]|nr:hypothetical protein AGMMS49975_25990 [Clostridia bacterium]